LTASFRRLRLLVAVMAAIALLVSACGGDDDDSTGATGSTGGGGDLSSLSGTLNGSGSSFQQTYDEAANAAFTENASGVTINYGAGGSSKGKQDLADKVVDFAGTDSLVKPEDASKYASGGGILYFPTVAAPITISYKLAGVDDLKLDAETLAKIFQGDIKTWNDDAIVALNDGADLPSTAIVPVHRADGSGTTSNFSKYLDTAAKGTWTLGTSDTLTWPTGGQAGNGNSGVASIIKGTDGAIGYVDLADATGSELQTAQIKNKDGDFVGPTLDGAAEAVKGAAVADDLTYSPIDAPGAGAYPITSPTWIIVYKKWSDSAKGNAMKAFLNFILTDGQSDFATQVGYAPLPTDLAQKAIAQLDQLQIG
jgi:phosphate transport system substrate-binding protein